MPTPIDQLRIVHYPAGVLREVAKHVEYSEEIRQIGLRMIELMRDADGIGLAAPQVGLGLRMFVADVPQMGPTKEGDPVSFTTEPQVYINPVLKDPTGGLEAYTEGCLSLPEITGDVLRPTEITITALGIDGEEFTVHGGGLLARCWQHENDHLDGVLILDRMIEPHKRRNRTLIRDLEASAGA